MSEAKKEKLTRAAEIVNQLDDNETELAGLVALSMQTGYDLGRMVEKTAQ